LVLGNSFIRIKIFPQFLEALIFGLQLSHHFVIFLAVFTLLPVQLFGSFLLLVPAVDQIVNMAVLFLFLLIQLCFKVFDMLELAVSLPLNDDRLLLFGFFFDF
jgi:hypothetical protein